MKPSHADTNNLTTTSFRIDCRDLLLLQERANERGFRSWGAYISHIIYLHAVTFEPDLLARLSGGDGPNRVKRASCDQNASTGLFRSKKRHR